MQSSLLMIDVLIHYLNDAFPLNYEKKVVYKSFKRSNKLSLDTSFGAPRVIKLDRNLWCLPKLRYTLSPQVN